MLARICMLLRLGPIEPGQTVSLKEFLPEWMKDPDEGPDWQSARSVAEIRYGHNR